MRRKIRPERALIASYVGPHAFAPGTRAALQGLGYSLVPAFSMGHFEDPACEPALRVVDERQYDRIPDGVSDPETPIVLLCGLRAPRLTDDRIVGCVARPVGLDALFPILQSALEDTPRTAPRVPTHLTARGIREDHRWVGSVTSLSEVGCYLRCDEQTPIGTTLSVQFALPRNGIVTTRAICVHIGVDGAGLRFTDSSEHARREIGGFVSERLATL